MTRSLTTTAAALAALAWLPPSTGSAAAQETTAREALEYLQLKDLSELSWEAQMRWSSPRAPAIAILRQASGPRTPAELDALADQVAAMVLDATLPGDVRREAKYALMDAAGTDGEGTPYPRAVDLLARLYEAGIVHLHSIMLADSVRGMAYMRELFERSERPPLCRWRYDGDRGWLTGGTRLLGGPPPPPGVRRLQLLGRR